ncbi:MAG: RHS repeat-associated core domain-containing protein, partial [Myxococcales bacterium]|nr:RHS repeat-associated core domain-containing protein [Myxococcales bacterium]
RIALVETQTIGNQNQTIRYQLGNHLGSASLELDENGDLISYEEYHPYGTTSFQSGCSAAEVSLKRYRYTAKERDDESGVNYHGARYYAPWLARWTAADPAVMIDGTNSLLSLREPYGKTEIEFDRDIALHEFNERGSDSPIFITPQAPLIGKSAFDFAPSNGDNRDWRPFIDE